MIKISDQAREYIEEKLKQTGHAAVAINVLRGGCSGLQYDFTYTNAPDLGDEEIDFGKFKIFIKPSAILFIIGTELFYEKTPTRAKLIFKNPNEKGRCGCGKSFNV